MTYCYSTNEENYQGYFATEAEATAEGADMAEEGASFWVAEVNYPIDFLRPSWMGDAICELVSERLYEEVGEVAECFVMTPEQLSTLGALVLAWISDNPGFSCFGVKNVRLVSGKELTA